MGLILDTSALVCLERNPRMWTTETIDKDDVVILPAIVWAEALTGVRLAGNAQQSARRLARLEAIRRQTRIYPFNDLIAEHYADIFTELRNAGTMIPQNDIQVAATARSLDFAVLVGANDEEHFRRITNLKVVSLNQG